MQTHVVPVETCEQCRFDGAAYTTRDAIRTLSGALPHLWRYATEGIDPDVLRRRPAPEVWSAVEYAAHSRDQIATMGKLLHAALTIDDLRLDSPDLSAVTHEHDGVIDPVIDQLGANGQRLASKADAAGADGLARPFTVDGERLDGEWVLRHAVHDTMHHLQDVGRGLHTLGAGAPSQEGQVAQLNSSGGGVPKLPVDAVEIGLRGLLGDIQRSREHHGRQWQALSLWSSEIIGELRADGHPIAAGSAGENITISGVQWPTLRPGARILIGEVLAEITSYATPCKKNAQWFSDGDFNRIAHERNPGTSRLYAAVLEGGRIRTGDAVVVEP